MASRSSITAALWGDPARRGLSWKASAAGLLLVAIAAGTSAQSTPAPAASAATHHSGHAAPICVGTGLSCANAASAVFDRHGALWLAWSAGGSVSVARSTDQGSTFGPAVVLSSHGALLDAGADARPQIVVDDKGHIAVAYGVFKDKAWNAQVLVSTSADDGATFSTPRSISQDGASQRFPALAFRPDGALFATWLDKRTVAAAKKQGQQQVGAAVAYAWSRDGGTTFADERIAQDHTCECCRLAVAFDPGRRPLVLFRSIFGDSERDHALLTFGDAGESNGSVRVAEDHWSIDGCPHHGPSVAVSADGTVHAAWFTLGKARQGLFYARSVDGGKSFSEPLAVGDAEKQAGRPFLYARGGDTWLVWKEFDGKRIFVKGRMSSDAGKTWSADKVLADTGGFADHPLLIEDGQRVYLSWFTRDEGYRLLTLEAP